MTISLHQLPCPLLAHSVFTGSSDFVNGLFHPLISPANLLLLAAVALALAQSRPLSLRQPILALMGGAILGMAALSLKTLLLAQLSVLSPLTLLIALSVVTWIPLPLIARSTLAALVGFILGLDSRPEFSNLLPALITMAGALMGISLAATAIAFYASLRPARPWADIGLRILAAWIAAISLLTFALAWRR